MSGIKEFLKRLKPLLCRIKSSDEEFRAEEHVHTRMYCWTKRDNVILVVSHNVVCIS
jgi:hypothetical protein